MTIVGSSRGYTCVAARDVVLTKLRPVRKFAPVQQVDSLPDVDELKARASGFVFVRNDDKGAVLDYAPGVTVGGSLYVTQDQIYLFYTKQSHFVVYRVAGARMRCSFKSLSPLAYKSTPFSELVADVPQNLLVLQKNETLYTFMEFHESVNALSGFPVCSYMEFYNNRPIVSFGTNVRYTNLMPIMTTQRALLPAMCRVPRFLGRQLTQDEGIISGDGEAQAAISDWAKGRAIENFGKVVHRQADFLADTVALLQIAKPASSRDPFFYSILSASEDDGAGIREFVNGESSVLYAIDETSYLNRKLVEARALARQAAEQYVESIKPTFLALVARFEVEVRQTLEQPRVINGITYLPSAVHPVFAYGNNHYSLEQLSAQLSNSVSAMDSDTLRATLESLFRNVGLSRFSVTDGVPVFSFNIQDALSSALEPFENNLKTIVEHVKKLRDYSLLPDGAFAGVEGNPFDNYNRCRQKHTFRRDCSDTTANFLIDGAHCESTADFFRHKRPQPQQGVWTLSSVDSSFEIKETSVGYDGANQECHIQFIARPICGYNAYHLSSNAVSDNSLLVLRSYFDSVFQNSLYSLVSLGQIDTTADDACVDTERNFCDGCRSRGDAHSDRYLSGTAGWNLATANKTLYELVVYVPTQRPVLSLGSVANEDSVQTAVTWYVSQRDLAAGSVLARALADVVESLDEGSTIVVASGDTFLTLTDAQAVGAITTSGVQALANSLRALSDETYSVNGVETIALSSSSRSRIAEIQRVIQQSVRSAAFWYQETVGPATEDSTVILNIMEAN